MRAANDVTVRQREAYRQLVQATHAPTLPGFTPWASPWAGVNRMATRLDPGFVNPRADVPRVHDVHGTPLWAVLPPRMCRPCVEASAPHAASRYLAGMKQNGIDALVGVFAGLRIAGLLLLWRKDAARDMAVAHLPHLTAAATFILLPVLVGVMLFSL